MTSMISSVRGRIVLGVMFTTLVAPGFVEAQTPPFNFNNVEYMPAGQREAAAHAFLAQAIQPGMSVSQARSTLQGAGAYCPPPRAGLLQCTHSSMQRPPGHDEQDVTWKVTVQADAHGRVRNAEVRRVVAGT